ncbi:MAG: hypothetical protein JWQ71_2201, partial [Pedosphaera sp.]|nr:hypothetical protein [Pedosphaera sp.]
MKLHFLLLLSVSVMVSPLCGFAAYPASNSVPPLILRGPKIDPNAPKPGDQVSPSVLQVIKLSNSDVTGEVIITYIDNDPSTYNLTPENIIWLQRIGLTPVLISAMIKHDQVLYDRVAAESQSFMTNQPAAQIPTEPQPEQPYEQQPASAMPPRSQNYYDDGTPQDVGFFYNSLSPYGSWANLPDYGWTWQPSFLSQNPDWTPYFDGGNWLYSNAGWYWNSIYPWGWAPFHFGRWFQHPNRGWCWTPGHVWSPSWVTWRSF